MMKSIRPNDDTLIKATIFLGNGNKFFISFIF
jgi:hypothetical protein